MSARVSKSTLTVPLLVGVGFAASGCARLATDSPGLPPREIVWSSLHLETEACRRRLAGAVLSGPVRLTGTENEEGRITLSYEVPIFVASVHGAGDGAVLPLKGQLSFECRDGRWSVHERHLRHWRAAGLSVMPDDFHP